MTSKSFLVIVALVLVHSTANAQPSGDKAAAEAVFREGRELMAKKLWEEACPKFEKSLALYQSASAALNLARCYAEQGRLAAAKTTLDRAVDLNRKTEDPARRHEIERLAAEDRKLIEPRVPHVRVIVSPEVTGTVVERNGIEVPTPMLGQPLPVDPGSFTIRVAAPGYKDVAQTSRVSEGQTVVVEIRLARADETIDGKGPPIVKSDASVVATPGLERPAAAPDAAIWPWAVGGVGLASLGVGIGFAVDYGFARADLEALCPRGTCAPARLEAVNDALDRWDRDTALMTTFGAVGAGLLVTAGVGLALESGGSKSVTVAPVLTPTLAALSITTRY